MSDHIRFFTEKCPCGSPFKSFEVKGRAATIFRIGNKSFSALTLGLDYEEASRVQLVQIFENKFEVRADVKQGVNEERLFEKIITNAQKFFQTQGIENVTIHKSEKSPIIGASGKFQEVIPLEKGRNE